MPDQRPRKPRPPESERLSLEYLTPAERTDYWTGRWLGPRPKPLTQTPRGDRREGAR